MKSYKNKQIGKLGELLAVDYLKNKGFQIKECNYRIRGGEIDIVALDGDVLVFIEVKTRTNNQFGSGVEAINSFKLQTLHKSAQFYIQKINWEDCPYRFDAIIIDISTKLIEHIENITY